MSIKRPNEAFARNAVLVIGDVMLDSFIYGSVTKISPEAPTPVMVGKREERMLGGAANVARGVAALDAYCVLVSVTGADQWGEQIARECEACNIDARLIHDPERETTRKVRFVSEEHSSHLLRIDWEDTHPARVGVVNTLIADALEVLPHVEAVVISDYDKGALPPRLIRAVIDQAKHLRIPVLVDPGRENPNIYRGATIVKPNRHELGRACATEQDYIEAVTTYAAQLDAKGVLVTRGDQGMTLYRKAAPPIHLPAHRVRVRDVSGAGDTVLATLAVALACDIEIEDALRLANDAAAIAVGKPGTAVVTKDELLAPKGKIVTETWNWNLLGQRLAEWRHAGLRIGFTNGCFDLIHPGHIKLLTEARAACDRLIVGVNTDDSVRKLKGPTRPIQKFMDRAEVLAAIDGVDLVVGFGADTPHVLIEYIRPSVIIKGSDHDPADVCGHDIAPVKIVESLKGMSTSSLIEGAQYQ